MLLLQKDLIDLFRRISRIGTTLPLAILIVGVIAMGLADVTFVDALISARHSAGIALIILIGVRARGAAAPPKFWATQIFWAARENLGNASF